MTDGRDIWNDQNQKERSLPGFRPPRAAAAGIAGCDVDEELAIARIVVRLGKRYGFCRSELSTGESSGIGKVKGLIPCEQRERTLMLLSGYVAYRLSLF